MKRRLNIKPGFGLLSEYKMSLAMSVAGAVSVFFLLMILNSVGSLFQTHFDLQAGFIPGLNVRFHTAADAGNVEQLKRRLQSEYPDMMIVSGLEARVEKATFSNGSGETLEGDLTLLGIDFTGTSTVVLQQDGKRFGCQVNGIDNFGSWIIQLQGCDELREGEAVISGTDGSVPVDIYASEDGRDVYFDDLDQPPDVVAAFFHVLEHLVMTHFDIRYSGLLYNRYVTPGDKGVRREFEMKWKRGILAYSRLIFSDPVFETPVLVSRNLLNENSRYEVETVANLNIGSKTNTVTMLDGFHFAAEQLYSSNLIVMSKDIFTTRFSDLPYHAVINVYGKDLQQLSAMKASIANETRDVDLVLKSEAVPRLLTQMSVVAAGEKALSGALYLILFLVMFIAMQKFYSIFEAQLFLLKLYGYDRTLFTSACSWILIVSGLLSLGALAIFQAMNNRILEHYFYPKIPLPLSVFCAYWVAGLGLLLPIYLIERYFNFARIDGVFRS